MGSTQPFLRRVMAVCVTAALGVAAAVALQPSAALADPAAPTPVSGTASPTAQVNGVVWSQVISKGVDFVGGSFNQSQPAGSAPGVGVTSRSNLFAFDVATGAAVPFHARTNGQVFSVAASADGSRIYIAGTFTSVNGQPRSRVAAITRSGDLIAGFAPEANGTVRSVITRGSTVYFGGAFSQVDGETRSRVAAVSTSGALLTFAPVVADYDVRALALSPDGSTLLLGGSFSRVNTTTGHGLAAVNSSTGQSRTWKASGAVSNWGSNAAIFSLATRGAVVYATGYSYIQPDGTGGGDLEGTAAMNWSDGSIKWVEDCHGDSYSSVPFNDAVYVASHAHDCSNVVGGWSSPGAPSQWRRAQAFSQSVAGVLAHDTQKYHDWGGTPSPRLVAGWSPSINTGTYTGQKQGAWSVAAGSSYVVFGGEFTAVNGARQTGLVRFKGQPDPADVTVSDPPSATPTPTPTPTDPPAVAVPARVGHPDAIALGSTGIAVRWTAPKGADGAHITGYVVKVYKGSTVVKTTRVGATKRLAVVTGLARSTAYRVGVAAGNAAGVGHVSVLDSTKTKASGKNASATKRPAKVKKPTASAGKARLKVHWKATTAKKVLATSSFQIRFVRHGHVVKVVKVSAHVRTKTVVELGRKLGYKVSVRAHNWAGWSEWSAPRTVRTR